MSSFTHAPLKRHPALQPLSRDHYVGLVQSRSLIHAAEKDAVARRAAVAEFLDAWRTEIAVHFDDEERLLAPLLESAVKDRMLREHSSLRNLVESLREERREVDPDADLIAWIGRTLETHIRWEERELFTGLQERLTDEQLDTLARETALLEASRPRNTCSAGTGGASS